MNLPDDFGLSPVGTLAHVGSLTPSWRHAAFWGAWDKSLAACSPALRPIAASSADKTDPTATHCFESVRHVQIGAVLIEPPTGIPITAGIVALHGYGRIGPLAGEPERWQWLASRGVAVLAIRVRGFPGSAREIGVLTEAPSGWIGHGLEALAISEDVPPSAQVAMWVVPEAVADVVNAARALQRWLGAPRPMFLHGESLGGGLAVIAAARSARHTPISRLAIGMPTLGDWPWRLRIRHSTPGSAGHDIQGLLVQHQQDIEKLSDALRLADAVVHARNVSCATLCKLAERDDVVPAPSAAATFNALASPPGMKRRFIVPYGHFDGGIRNARRHAIFDRAIDEFLDPAIETADVIDRFESVLESGDRVPGETAPAEISARPSRDRSPLSLFGGDITAGGSTLTAQPADTMIGKPPESPPTSAAPGKPRGEVSLERILCDCYKAAGRTLDDLPYTPQFEGIVSATRGEFPAITEREALHKLHNIRKAGRLPKLGRSQGTKPAVQANDERLLVELVEGAVGSTGQRDQLPYTEVFDRLVWAFNQRTGRSLPPHEVWRLVATLSK